MAGVVDQFKSKSANLEVRDLRALTDEEHRVMYGIEARSRTRVAPPKLGVPSAWVGPNSEVEVLFLAVRIGIVELFTQREGFGEQAWGRFDADSWADGELTLRYLPDNEVVVRVERANGQPVDGFTLWQWEEHPRANQKIDVGGSSRRLRLQAGTHFVMVHGEGLARSEPVAIEVGAEPLDDVVFQLEPLRRAHGRVVDVEGRPFVGGLVQPWVNAGPQLLEKYGPPLVADAAGRFEGRFLADGDNRVTVYEEGRKGAIYSFHADTERGAALGDLPVYPARDMTMAIAPALAKTGTFHLSMDGGVRQMAERATVDGALLIDAAAPGGYVTSVRHPDGSFTGFRLSLHASGPWLRWIGSTYDAVFAFDPEQLPVSMRDEARFLKISAYDPHIENLVTRVVVLETKADIGFVPHGQLKLEWTDSRQKVLAQAFVDVAPGERFTATPDETFRDVVLRFLQPDGRALVGATIYYGYPQMTGGFEATVQTGPDGRATVPNVSGNTLALGVGHQSIGYAFGLEATFAGTNEADVVVATDSSCSIRLVDDQRPVTGVEVYLACAEPRALLFPTVPDDEGWARFGRLGAGRYRILLRVPGYFPLDEIVEVAGRTKRTFEARRTGDLELTFGRRGAPAASVPFQLTEERTGEDVATWLAAGKARGTATANAAGVALLEGLPHGSYVLNVEGRRQRFEVVARQRTAKRVELE